MAELQTAASHEDLLEFLYLTPVGITRFQADGTIDMANPAAAQLLMPLARDGNLTNLYTLLAALIPDLAARIAGFQSISGQIFDQLQLAVPLTRTVLALGINKINAGTFMAVIQDITTAIENESRIRDDQQRFHAIFENIRDYAICMVKLDGRIEAWNRSLQRLGGWEPADVDGLSAGIFFEPEASGDAAMTGLLDRAARRGTAEFDGWGVRKNGTVFWGNTVATALPDREGNANGFVLVTRDISERKRIQDKLVALATTDPLTGALNRRAGDEKLEEAFRHWQRYHRVCSMLMIDCDKFKSINDRWGHAGGDEVLIALVRICQDRLRIANAVIRWGGEEFLLLLPETNGATAQAAAERLRLAIEALCIDRDGGTIKLTVSIGIAETEDADTAAGQVVQRADRALFRAKAAGRNRVAVA